MVYVCAGMSRSGSTWLFNTVRVLLKTAGAPDIAGGYMGQMEELITHRTAIIKLHPYYADVAARADVILTSHRDLRDVVASTHRHYQVGFSTTLVNNCVRDHLRWSQIADYDLHYERLLVDKLAEVKKIAAVLKLPPQTLDQLPYEAILREIEGEKFVKQFSESTEYDAVNLLHKGHITDGRHGSWENVVPKEFVAAIEKEFRGWLTAQGYLDSPLGISR
jgi:hypothetical protein